MNTRYSTTRPYLPALAAVLVLTALITVFQSESFAQGTRWIEKFPNAQEGGWLWHGIEPDGATFWGWDLNGDGRFEKYKWIIEVPQKPTIEFFVWDKDQNNRPEGYAWAESGRWIESVWDTNGDGSYELLRSYISTQACSLVTLKNNFQTKYREHIDAQRTGNSLLIRRAYIEYQHASLTFNACKAMAVAGE